MASTFALAPGPFKGQEPDGRHLNPPAFVPQRLPPTVAGDQVFHCVSLSPAAPQFETPLTACSNLSTNLSQYQPSDFSDFDEDPFFGASLDLLDDAADLHDPLALRAKGVAATVTTTAKTMAKQPHDNRDGASYPLTPTHTASVHTTTPTSEPRGSIAPLSADDIPDSISPEELQMPFHPPHAVVQPSDLTSSHAGSHRNSEDSLAPRPVAVNPQSPRVTVSVWDKSDGPRVDAVARTFDEDGQCAARSDLRSAGDLISSAHRPHFSAAAPDAPGSWHQTSPPHRIGLDPRHRPIDEVPSINEVATRRNAQRRNRDVSNWLANQLDESSAPQDTSSHDMCAMEKLRQDTQDGIPLGDQTENRFVPGQTYYNEAGGGPLTQEDREIIAEDHKWADAPMLQHIALSPGRATQPQSSQAAIERFERLCRDNDSILSRSATWGTRRRSHPSVLDADIENVTGGNFLKKLTIGRGSGDKGSSRSGGLLKDLRGLVRRPSASSLRKRARSRSHGTADEEPAEQPSGGEQPQRGKRDSTPHLSPTPRSPSWGRKPTPSLNTALVSMAQSIVNIGTAVPRSGGSSPMPSPRIGLSMRNTLRRPRSKSEVPKASATSAGVPAESHPNLIEMWKKTGGPPVTPLGKTMNLGGGGGWAAGGGPDDDDDDDDDDFDEDNDMRTNPNIIDSLSPDFAGFQQHLLTLNPGLDLSHGYLVERISQQQVIRYKQLLNTKIKHLGLGGGCPCGPLCVALGGSANVLDHQKSDGQEANEAADDGVPAEGVIGKESFPRDIPMPPTSRLPAEFECQLCFQRKRFQKPSDWTKHVHEDVQPFTCTWDKCRDAKMFKRKADWVRHENEGHRHLEWWTCDVEDCRHTCYRRDNFLQHLVREHKFVEPKIKTKAAMKRSGGLDPTWVRVEQCHIETSTRPQDEPCRFCGKAFPTWKKLTVHLAKHMEQIALPVLRLVAARELTAETVVSPVQDLAPRPMIPLPEQPPPGARFPVAAQWQHQQQASLHGYRQPPPYAGQGPFMYSLPTPEQTQHPSSFYGPQFHNNSQVLKQPAMGLEGMNQGYETNPQRVRAMSGSSHAFAQAPSAYMVPNSSSKEAPAPAEPFRQVNGLGLQNVGDGSLGGGMVSYETMMDPCGIYGSPFSGRGSLSTPASTFSPSFQNGRGMGRHDQAWDDGRQAKFM
ncbi:hypothetical protein CDD83_10575 [Cordyceps sp. RAO-2017]|nr:hypothetical protein CDD83_10575 [Cordyceps sp. RAO-2017]